VIIQHPITRLFPGVDLSIDGAVSIHYAILMIGNIRALVHKYLQNSFNFFVLLVRLTFVLENLATKFDATLTGSNTQVFNSPEINP
jgi:hypothetical protein